MENRKKRVALQCATFAALFGLMCLFMDMMEETKEQTTYSIMLEDLALGSGETNGENGGGGSSDGESDDPVWGGLDNFLIGQGFYKDEREIREECPVSEENSSETTASGSAGNASGSVSTSESNSQTNNGGRTDIRCASGNTNCTAIDC